MPKKDNGRPTEEHTLAFVAPEQKRPRGRPRKPATILGGGGEPEPVASPSQTVETDPEIAALERKFDTAFSQLEAQQAQVSAEQARRDPVGAAQARYRSALAAKEPAVRRSRAKLRAFLPRVERAFLIASKTWPPEDAIQQRRNRALTLATDLTNALQSDPLEPIEELIGKLTAQRLVGEWPREIEKQIAGLDGRENEIMGRLRELATAISELTRSSAVSETRLLRVEHPVPPLHQAGPLDFDPMA